MSRRILLVFLLIPFLLNGYSQTTFIKTYSFNDWEWAWDVKQTNDKGYVLVGFTKDDVTDDNDIFLIKTDSLGDTVWTKTYDYTSNDDGKAVVQSHDGGYIIAGSRLIKTDSNGDTLWTKAYSGINSIIQTSDSNYILTGSQYIGVGNNDVSLIKVDSIGNEIWNQTYGGTKIDIGKSLLQTYDGGYIIGGESNKDPYLIKTDSNGNEVWSKIYTCPDSMCYLESIEQTNDSGFVLAIHRAEFLGYERIYLIKTDANGDSVWTKSYGMFSFPNSVAKTPDGGYIIGGTSGDFGGNGSSNLLLMKIDVLGDTIWTNIYGGSYNDWGYATQSTSDGGYVIAGAMWFGTYKDIVLVKTDSLGNAPPFVSVSELTYNQNTFTVYPNPTTGRITITNVSQNENMSIAISNVLGKLVYKGKQTDNQIDLSDLSNGIYLLQVETGKGTLKKKIIKL